MQNFRKPDKRKIKNYEFFDLSKNLTGIKQAKRSKKPMKKSKIENRKFEKSKIKQNNFLAKRSLKNKDFSNLMQSFATKLAANYGTL